MDVMAQARLGWMNHASAFLWSQASCIHPPTVQPSALTPATIHAVSLDDVRSLLDAPSPAAHVTYRADGRAAVPAW